MQQGFIALNVKIEVRLNDQRFNKKKEKVDNKTPDEKHVFIYNCGTLHKTCDSLHAKITKNGDKLCF